MASGSFDNTVKIWDANLVTEAAEGSSVPEGGSEAKRAKTGGQSSESGDKNALSNLGGHKAWSLKSTHTAHMCGGPKKVGRTKKLVD